MINVNPDLAFDEARSIYNIMECKDIIVKEIMKHYEEIKGNEEKRDAFVTSLAYFAVGDRKEIARHFNEVKLSGLGKEAEPVIPVVY